MNVSTLRFNLESSCMECRTGVTTVDVDDSELEQPLSSYFFCLSCLDDIYSSSTLAKDSPTQQLTCSVHNWMYPVNAECPGCVVRPYERPALTGNLNSFLSNDP